MVYKRYIYRNGKKFGPYYYKTYRDKDGKTHSEYVEDKSAVTETFRKRFPKINFNKHQTLFILFGIMLLLVLGFVFLSNHVAQGGGINSEQTKGFSLSNLVKSFYSFTGFTADETPTPESSTPSETTTSNSGTSNEQTTNTENTPENPTTTETTQDQTPTENIPEQSNETNATTETNQTSQNETTSETNGTNINETIIENNGTNASGGGVGGGGSGGFNVTNGTNPGVNETNSNENFTNGTIFNESLTNETLVMNETNVTVLNETSNYTLQTSVRQYGAVLGKPVKWEKRVKVEVEGQQSIDGLTVDLPELAGNVSVKKVNEYGEEEIVANVRNEKNVQEVQPTISGNSVEDSNGIGFFGKTFNFILGFFRGMTAKAIDNVGENVQVDVTDQINNNDELVLQYYTDAPYSVEENTSGGKKVMVVGPQGVDYKDVLIFSSLSEDLNIRSPNLVEIFWENNKTYVPVENIYDTDDNGIYDYVEWVAPHLSNQTFDIIVITKAQHLDSDRNFISDIYNEVKELDGNWSEPISSNEYVRVTFEENLTHVNDITLYPKIIDGTPVIDVYQVNDSNLITEFSNLTSEAYNKVFLTNLNGSQDTFDLKVLNGTLEFDHIIDPVVAQTSDSISIDMQPLSNNTLLLARINSSVSNRTGNLLSFSTIFTNGTTKQGPFLVNSTPLGNISAVAIDMINFSHFGLVYMYFDLQDEQRAIWDVNGTRLAGSNCVDCSVVQYYDVCAAHLNNRTMFGYVDSVESNFDVIGFWDNSTTATIPVAEFSPDTTLAPTTNNTNVIDCKSINSTAAIYAWIDYTPNPDAATFSIWTNLGVQLGSDVVIDSDVGSTGAIAATTLDTNKFAVAWYDGTDQDITLAIRYINQTVILAPTDIDTLSGTGNRLDIGTVQDLYGTNNLALVWYNQSRGAIMGEVLDTWGNNISNAFNIETAPNTSATFSEISVIGKNAVSGLGLCPGTWAVAYTNSTGATLLKTYFINGSTWNGNGCPLQNVPKWSLNTTNSTFAGSSILYSVNWSSDTNLQGYIFSFDNGTGTFTNDSLVSMTGTPAWSNVTKVANNTVNSVVRWIIYTKDFRNRYNSTSTFSYTANNTAPTQGTPTLSPASVDTTNNLTCYNQTTSDFNGNSVTNVYNWKISGTSMMLLNMPFDSNVSLTTSYVKDFSGNYYNGTLSAGLPTWNASGKVGGDYEFDGVNDYISLPSGLPAVTSSGTMMAWVKLNGYTSTNDYAILANYNGGAVSDGEYLLHVSHTHNVEAYIGPDGLAQAAFPSTGVWHHVAVTYAPNNIQLYIDGVASGAADTSFASTAGGLQSYIGEDADAAANPNPNREFNGSIDDVRWYNRSLTSMQVYKIYQESQNGYSNASTIVSSEVLSGQNWTCEVFPSDAYDNGTKAINYTTFASANTAPNVTLSSPSEGDSLNSSQALQFTCNVTDDYDIVNVTLYGNWSASGWHANSTVTLTGAPNVSNNITFNITGITDGNYKWNCLAFDNSSTSSWAVANRTFAFDDCELIQLSASRTLSANNCSYYNFTANNIYLDCANNMIYGENNDTYWGVEAKGRTNITVQNCSLQKYAKVILFNGTNNSYVLNNTLYNNSHLSTGDLNTYGFYLENSHNATINKVNITKLWVNSTQTSSCVSATLYGFYISNSNDTLINNSILDGVSGRYVVDSDPEGGGCQPADSNSIGQGGYFTSTNYFSPLKIINSNFSNIGSPNNKDMFYIYNVSNLQVNSSTFKNASIFFKIYDGGNFSFYNDRFNSSSQGVQFLTTGETSFPSYLVFYQNEENHMYRTGSTFGVYLTYDFLLGANVSGNLFNNLSGYGIYTISDNLNIKNNIFQNFPYSYAVSNLYIYDPTNNLTTDNNTFFNSTGNSGIAITIDSNNVTLVNNNITSCNIGIYLSAAKDNLSVYNSTITGCTNDTYVGMGSDNLSYYNVSFNKSNTQFQVSGNGSFNVFYNFITNVTNQNAAGISSAIVNATTFNSYKNVLNSTTDSNGLTSDWIQSYNQTGNSVRFSNCTGGLDVTNTTCVTPHNVTASKTGYSLTTSNVTINTNTVSNFILYTPYILAYIPVTDVFSIAEPNNQTFSITYTNSSPVTIKWFVNNTERVSYQNNSQFDWVGNYSQAGLYVIKVNLSDSNGLLDDQNWTMTVNDTNSAPTHSVPLISPYNGTDTENFTCYNQSTVDPEGDSVYNIYNWLVNGNSFMLLNMPFDTNFGSVVKDYSGRGANGTIVGSLTFADGKVGKAYDFVSGGIGSNYINVLNTSLNLSQNYTIAYLGYDNLWLSPTSSAFSFSNQNNATQSLYFSVSGSDLILYFDGVSSSKNQVPQTSAWFMHTIACNATACTVYLNGTKDNTTINAPPSNIGNYNLTIGIKPGALSSFNGLVDGFRIYNRTLSSTQIYQLYQDEVNGYSNSSTIVADETLTGENWTCQVTPTDSVSEGAMKFNSTTLSSAFSVSISLSTKLGQKINWTLSSLPTYNQSAEGNNGVDESDYYINISVEGGTADIYMKANDDLKTSGGDVLSISNETYSYNYTNFSVPSNNKTSLTTNYSDNKIGNAMTNSSVIFLKFFLNAPASQAAGVYNNSLLFKAVQTGQTP